MALQAFDVKVNQTISQVTKTDLGMVITNTDGKKQVFDEVVFASHGDESYRMLSEELKAEFAPLQHFKYQENIAYLHSDIELMPKRKRAWAAWNYLRDIDNKTTGKNASGKSTNSTNSVAVSYWMNLLQNIDCKTPLLVTLNPTSLPKDELIHQKIVYEHPVFDTAAMAAQSQIKALQGKHNLWFCGSYLGYGFHEDGLKSSANLAELWNIALPWQKTNKDSDNQQQKAQSVNQTAVR